MGAQIVLRPITAAVFFWCLLGNPSGRAGAAPVLAPRLVSAALLAQAPAGDQAPEVSDRDSKAVVRERVSSHNWALLIGVNNYEVANDLKYPDRDMRALHDCLRTAGFPEEQVAALSDQAHEPDQKPTAPNINRELERLLGSFDPRTGRRLRPGAIGPEDLVVIAFSGHGIHLGGKSYFCPADARLEAPQTTLIPLDDLFARLAAAPARQKLLVVDACRNDPTQKGVRAAGFGGAKQLGQSLERPPVGILVLSSCTTGQFSYEDEGLKHGVFTHYLVEGLNGSADDDGDGSVTLLDLYRYAGRRTEDRVARVLKGEQRPMLKGELSGDFEIGSRHRRYLEVLESGRQALTKGRHDRAIRAFGEALALAPRSVDARLARARGALDTADLARALADCEEAIRVRPDEAEAFEIRGEVYAGQSRDDLALASFDEAIRIDPGYARAFAERGWVRWTHDDFDEALADAARAIEFDPKSGGGYVVRAVALRDLGDPTAARACARTGLATFEIKEPGDYLVRARLKLLGGARDRALADLDKAIELNPRCGPAYSERGGMFEADGKLDEALADYRKAAELYPKEASSHRSLGDVLLAKGETTAALDEFNAALGIDPHEIGALSGRGRLLQDSGKYDEAIVDFSRIIDLRPKLAWPYVARGKSYTSKADYERALADLGRAIELDSDDVEAYNTRGDVYFYRKEYDDALADYGRALELAPKNSLYYTNRGNAYYRKKDYDRALADLDRALKLDPKNAGAYNLRANIRYDKDEYDDALADYTTAIEINPNNAWYFNNRGDAYYWKNDLDEAIADYTRAIQIDSDHVAAHAGLATAYLRRNDREKADPILDRLRKLNPDHQVVRALERRAATAVTNRTDSQSVLRLHWKLWDGTWTDWAKVEIDAGDTWTYSKPGATAAQIQFDRVAGNNQFDPQTEDVQTIQADAGTELNSLTPPLYFLYLDGSEQKLGQVDRVAEAAARKLLGVVTIYNHTQVAGGKIHYSLRWKGADGVWRDWVPKELEPGYHNWHWQVGATGCQIKYDSVVGDDQYTATEYTLEINLVAAGQDPRDTDGKPYYFQFKDATTLGFYTGKPPE